MNVMYFLIKPTKELVRYNEFIGNFDGYHNDIHLQSYGDIPRFKKVYKWVEDRENTVKGALYRYKHYNQDECSTKDYIKVKPKWFQGKYKRAIRQTIIDAIKEVNKMSCAPNKSHAKYSGKSMSMSRSPASTTKSHKMSGAHGTGKSSSTKSLVNHGGSRVGEGKRGFKSGPVSSRPKTID